MKKFILFLSLVFFALACEKNDEADWKYENDLSLHDATILNGFDKVQISKKEAPNSEKSVLITFLLVDLDDGKKAIILFENPAFQPFVGMKISSYQTYKYCFFEAYELATEKGIINADAQLKYIKGNILSKEPKPFVPTEKTGIVDEHFFFETRESLVWDISDETSPIELFFIRIDGVLYYTEVLTYKMRDELEAIPFGKKVKLSLENERAFSSIEELD